MTLDPTDPAAAPYEELRKQNEEQTKRVREERARRARGEPAPAKAPAAEEE